jgi:hypothetical protein
LFHINPALRNFFRYMFHVFKKFASTASLLTKPLGDDSNRGPISLIRDSDF